MLEELGKLIDYLTGGREDFESFLTATLRISYKVAVTFLAQPLDDS